MPAHSHGLAGSLFTESHPGNDDASQECDVASGDDEDSAAVYAGSSSSAPIKPSTEAESHWLSVLDFEKESVKSSFGPNISKATRRWGGDVKTSAFRALRQDPCLHACFDKAKGSNKSLIDSSLSTSSAAGASAHAIITAQGIVKDWVDFLESYSKQHESKKDKVWEDFYNDRAKVLKEWALKPLDDALRLQAGIYGKAVSTIRNGVLAAADSAIKSVLKDSPPSEGFFFGNPSDELHSQVQLEFMTKQLKSPAPSFRGKGKYTPARRPQPSSYKSSTSTTTTPASSSKSSSNRAPFRKPRGGKKER